MGGDGGVIASSRQYMRGAGSASTTGDSHATVKAANNDPAVQQEERRQHLTLCAISHEPLFPEKASQEEQQPIVVCPLGKLYFKEAAIEGLLKSEPALEHVRGLKDLSAVRFSVGDETNRYSCPITGTDFLRGKQKLFVLVPGNPEQPNVVTEKGYQIITQNKMESEYGPIQRKIALFPSKEEEIAIRNELLEKKRKRKAKHGNKSKKQKTPS